MRIIIIILRRKLMTVISISYSRGSWKRMNILLCDPNIAEIIFFSSFEKSIQIKKEKLFTWLVDKVLFHWNIIRKSHFPLWELTSTTTKNIRKRNQSIPNRITKPSQLGYESLFSFHHKDFLSSIFFVSR